MKKSHILILILVASAVRLAPFLWTGMPFSTDSWPLISNVETLLSRTPIELGSNTFGGYNNFWPASQIFGTVLVRITSLSAADSMAFGIPLASSTFIVIFYALSRRITGSEGTAFLSSLILALAYPLALFTAGVTKETFAIPIYLLLILLFIISLEGGRRRKTTALFLIVALSLVTAHHFTPLMTIAILGVGAGTLIANSLRNRLHLPKSSLALPALLALLFVTYYFGFARDADFSLPELSEWISAGAYQLLGLSAATYLALSNSKENQDRGKLYPILITCVILAIAFVGTEVPLISGAPVLPKRYLIFATPFLIAGPIGILGYRRISGSKVWPFVIGWIASIIAVLSYSVFGTGELHLTLGYRTMNFLLPPLSVFLAAGIVRIWNADTRRSPLIAGTLAAAVVGASLLSYYAAIGMEERYMGYQALNTEGEFEASEWVSSNWRGTIAADIKAAYLLGGYFGADVDMVSGYSYLGGGEAQPPALYIYRQMYKNGYVLGPYGQRLPSGWPDKVEGMNLVYTNEFARVYGRVVNDQT